METFADELKELKGFITDLKADRAAQKEKEAREAWTKYTSLSLVFIAVLAAIASQWSGKYSGRVLVALNDATFHQAQASDQWAYYQAKSIKQNLYEMAKEQLDALPLSATGTEATAKEKLGARVTKYAQDQKAIQTEARRLEAARDAARGVATEANARGGGMGLAISILQISIALGSICLVTKRKSLWYLSLGFAVLGALKMVEVWLR